MNIDEHRQRIALAVHEGTGVRCTPDPEGNPQVPCWLLLGHTGEVVTMDPDFRLEFDLTLLISLNDEKWTKTIDALLTGQRNVFKALRGVAEASRWDDYGLYNWANVDYWSVRVPVSVLVS